MIKGIRAYMSEGFVGVEIPQMNTHIYTSIEYPQLRVSFDLFGKRHHTDAITFAHTLKNLVTGYYERGEEVDERD